MWWNRYELTASGHTVCRGVGGDPGMISTFTSARATRWAGGVLVVAASVLGIGVGPFASSASAAGDVPTVVTVSPVSATISSGGCAVLTAFATKADGTPAVGTTINVEATESAAAGTASPLAPCAVSGGAATTTIWTNSVVGGSAGFLGFGATPGTATLGFLAASTDSNGEVRIGVSSSLVGSMSVVAYYNNGGGAAPAAGNPTSNTSTVSVTAGGTAAASKLTVTPTSQTQYVGSSASYTVTALGSSNNPVPGVAVDYVVSGPDPQTPLRQCGANTAADGTAACAITNGGTVGTDTITFYINASGGTAGPDSGEIQATATAVFQALPAGGLSVSSASCSNTRVAGPITGNTCSNSTATHTVSFTATVTNTSTQAPASGVAVAWNRTTSSPAGDTTLSATSCTTAADGTCSITLSEPSTSAGETKSLTASVGSSNASAVAGWQQPVATYFSASPSLQTVTNGGTAAFTAKVLDQFGTGMTTTQNVSYVVSAGRNAGTHGSGSTGTNGAVSFSYSDAAPTSTSTTTTDTVRFTDTSAASPGSTTGTGTVTDAITDTVNYISGSTQAGLIALDVSGNCNTTSPTSTNSNTVGTATVKVCALVTNASGTKLLGKPVTFAVSIGKVDSTSPQTNPAPSVTVDTDANGVATAYVSSAAAGTQAVTAQSDAVSATGTVSYSTSVANLKTVKITPATTAFAPGSSQTFTATATDAGGNPIAGAPLLFVVSGPGTIGGGSNQLVTSAANGTASVVLASTAADSGTGSVTVSVQNASATQCQASGGACSAVATYTVKVGAGSTTLLLYPEKNVSAGASNAEGVEAVVLNADGSVAPNQVVRFKVTGANTATGAETTASSGAAVFAYTAANAGTDTITAYDDVNNNNVQDAGEPTATTTATIFPAGCTTCGGGGSKTEHPTLTITQSRSNSHQEKLTLKVTSSPKLANATVTFYQVKKGVRHKIGPGTTGRGGKVTGTLKAAHGLTLKFQVKVKGKAGVKSGYSKVVTVHVQ
jgi:adhesin/invasin